MRRAYIVHSVTDSEDRAAVVFADNNREARYSGYWELQQVVFCGCEFIDVRARRAPEFDCYANTGEVPVQAKLDAGWWWTCLKCGKVVRKKDDAEDYDDGYDLRHAVVEGNDVYCNKCVEQVNAHDPH